MENYIKILKNIIYQIKNFNYYEDLYSLPNYLRTPYAGVGSRKSPEIIKRLMSLIATILELCGYLLRTGYAKGSDEAFEKGVYLERNKEVFIIEKGYKGSKSRFFNILPKAYEIAEKYHPNWDILDLYSRKLIARTSHIILGEYLNNPVKFITTWTPNGQIIGGTGQALRIGLGYNIKFFNLANTFNLNELFSFIKIITNNAYCIKFN